MMKLRALIDASLSTMSASELAVLMWSFGTLGYDMSPVWDRVLRVDLGKSYDASDVDKILKSIELQRSENLHSGLRSLKDDLIINLTALKTPPKKRAGLKSAT